MAKKRRRRARAELPVVDYVDDEGNVLVLRQSLTAKTIEKVREGPASAAASQEDAWRRRSEMLFERLAVSWEIAGVPIKDQKTLLARYRMADPRMQEWVRRTIATHLERHIPELAG